ncbi:MAG: chemotaxis protein CheW [Clostridiales bacterium]|jgi:purine-binding chemotaxis protein CheW|nr:chemotaxis protein CheW [Clostridiales bacterium]
MAENERAAETGLEEEDTAKDKYLTFDIASEVYGVEIADIKEIISVRPITETPETPDYVEGVINLRGDIIPVIDARARFAQERKEYDEQTCIVVMEYDEYVVGLIVDRVREVAFIGEASVSPPPRAKLNHQNQYVKNIGRASGNITFLMDVGKFLFWDRR